MNKTFLGTIKPINGLVTKQYVTPCPYHNHDLWELVFFLEGESINTVNNSQYNATRGDVFLLGPACLHQIEITKAPHLHQDVYFSQEEIEQAFYNLPEILREKIISGNRILHLKLNGDNYTVARNYLVNLLKFTILDTTSNKDVEVHESQKFLASSLLNFVAGLYLINYSTRNSQTPKWLTDFINELQKPEVFSKRVNEIIAQTNYSHSQVGTVFKQYKGMTLVDYLIDIRINYAKELLERTNESILNISEDCGYSSLSSFIKTFREKVGCSPLQFRKKHIIEF